jgi:hypothetical protein
MSGFSADWLALREPADHASINAGLRRALCAHFCDRQELTILDLGSGTGSNMRGLAPDLPAGQQNWRLVDYDTALLTRAKANPPRVSGREINIQTHHHDLSSGDLGSLMDGAGLVTASALFDLISVSIIKVIVGQIAAARVPFYTVLTYDGVAAWLPEHPADREMRELFNQHQQTDKGFGQAAGPGATDALAEAFRGHGYRVSRGTSPWVLKRQNAALRREVDAGWASAVRETGALPGHTIDDWEASRASTDDAVTVVGHEDLLALPPAA